MPTYTATAHPVMAKAQLKKWLGTMGLGAMADWTWNLMQTLGDMSSEELLLHMYEHPVFKERFRVIFELQEDGKPAMSVSEVLALETSYAEIMHASGLPPKFFNNYKDFQKLIREDVSPAELAQRVDEGYRAVQRAPQQVKDAFAAWFGPAGPGALASFFLDPDKSMPALMDMVQEAQVGGAGKMLGFDIRKDTAAQLVDFGVDFKSATQGFQQLADISALFDETVGEGQKHVGGPTTFTGWAVQGGGIGQWKGQGQGGDGGKPMGKPEPVHPTTWLFGNADGQTVLPEGFATMGGEAAKTYNDLDAEREGIAFVFGTDAAKAKLVKRRLESRVASTGGGGSAAATQAGVIGLGSSGA